MTPRGARSDEEALWSMDYGHSNT